MTEWTIVTVIAVLVEILATVTLPMIKLTNKITVIEERQENHDTDIKELKDTLNQKGGR